MRILRVAQKLYPDEKGGGAYHAHAMSRDQAAMGHDVTVLTIGSGPSKENRDGYTVVRKPSILEPLGNEISIGAARFLQQAGPFDVVHAHSHLYFLSNLAAVRRRLSSTPLAITNHGLFSQTAPEKLFNAYLETLGRWTFESADVVFCYTKIDQRRIRDLGVTSPIRVITNGIDTERFTPQGPVSELINHDGSVVLFVGRLVEGKRPDVAVQAIDRLGDDHDVAMYVCGDGPLESTLKKNADPRITFLGSVPYDEMPAVYRAADVLVLTSRAEGVPRTIMEALSSGVPVVSSDLPQIRSAFGDSIAYVPGGDPEALADRISETLAAGSEPTLDARFSWDRTVAETTAGLEAVVDGSLERSGPSPAVPTDSVRRVDR